MTGAGFIVVLVAIGLFTLAFQGRLPAFDFGTLQGSLAWTANTTANDGSLWRFAAVTLLVMLLFFLAVAIIRFALRPLTPAPPPQNLPVDGTGQVVVRDRIAPIILGIGSVAILAITIAILVAFTYLATNDAAGNQSLLDKIDTIYMGVFTAVLPVFATWVGTVIAFYYTNDAFRQAAASTRETLAGAETVRHPVFERMIPYDKIAKVEVEDRKVAQDVDLAKIYAMMIGPISRVIIFEQPTKNAVFIIRKRLVPDPRTTESWPKTVKEYRALGNNGSDSTNFGFVPVSASVEEAKQVMANAKCVDLFVTNTGQSTDAVIGWLTDDRLRG